jgi:hypothetical protein
VVTFNPTYLSILLPTKGFLFLISFIVGDMNVIGYDAHIMMMMMMMIGMNIFLMELCLKLLLYFVGVILSLLVHKVKIYSYLIAKSWLETFYLFGPKDAAYF